MQLQARRMGDIRILDLSGNLDSRGAPQVSRWFEQVARQAPVFIVINMKEVQFLDSTGLSSLVQGMKRARQAGGDVRLCCLRQPVRVVLELTRLDRVFEVYNLEEDALRAFTGQSSPVS